jgi:hypothetical protein
MPAPGSTWGILLGAAVNVLIAASIYWLAVIAIAVGLGAPQDPDGRQMRWDHTWVVAGVFAVSIAAFILAQPISNLWMHLDERILFGLGGVAWFTPVILPVIVLHGLYRIAWPSALLYTVSLHLLAGVIGVCLVGGLSAIIGWIAR